MRSDLDMLKAITEQVAEQAQPGGRWDEAEEAVNAVLHVLYENRSDCDLWQPVYDAIKAAYVGSPQWSDEPVRGGSQ